VYGHTHKQLLTQASERWVVNPGAAGATTLVPIGQGSIDHRKALELLKSIDYQGFLSGEWIAWEPYEIHLPRELATLKGYEREIM
jgi:sugar phosphate isomerase/epimerase